MKYTYILLSRVWAVVSWVIILIETSIRLGLRALEPFTSETEITWFQYSFLLIWCGFMSFFGSYRGFHQEFSPRLVIRAYEGLTESSVWWLHLPWVSPLMVGGFIYATRRRLIRAWSLLCWIILAVFICNMIPYPWRSFVDAGVVCSCGWGAISILLFSFRLTFSSFRPTVASDFPSLTDPVAATVLSMQEPGSDSTSSDLKASAAHGSLQLLPNAA